MEHFDIGDNINIKDFNAIVYLLRKFKRLTSDLKLGANVLESDYGTYTFSNGLTSVGGNFIIESDVTVSSSDCLKNCFYSFHFTAIDVNLSGSVNRRVVSVTGGTGENGVLELTLPTDLIMPDEVLLSDFKVDIVFDEHEYYTPITSLDITLEVDKLHIDIGETNTVTATVLNDQGEAVSGLDLSFNVNGDIEVVTTDNDGVASITYTGTGVGWVNVSVSRENVKFYDGEILIAEFTGNSIKLGYYAGDNWLPSVGDVVIDWGDGTTSTVNNPTTSLTHNYADGVNNHDITFIGNVTSIGNRCFVNCTGLTTVSIPNTVTSLDNACFSNCTGLTSITIPNTVTSLGASCFNECTRLTSVVIPSSVTSLGEMCFLNCTGLTSVVIPSSVTRIGGYCFGGCSSLVDYELYWTSINIIPYDSSKMPANTNTKFIVPKDRVGAYTYHINKYPIDKVFGRGEVLTLTCSGSSIPTHQNIELSGYLRDSGTPMAGKTIKIYDGSTLIATTTTDSAGRYTFLTNGQHLGVGVHTLKAVYGTNESNIVSVIVTSGYTLELTSSTPIIQSGDSASIVATVKNQGSPVSLFGASVDYVIKHGSTILDSGSASLDSSGQATITYTGTGTGEIDVEVTYQDIGIYLQETYVIYDSIFADVGVTGSHNTNWWNTQSTNISISTDNTGTTVSNTATSGYSRDHAHDGSPIPSGWNDKIALMESMFTKPFAVEFNILTLGTDNGIFLSNGSNTITKYFSQISATANSHIKIICDGSTAKFYRDGTLISTDNYTIGSTSSFAFRVNNQSAIKYNNLCIYPI